MARFTDGKKTVEIKMMTWEDNNYTPDWSNDFYDVGGLEYDDDKDAYIVKDVDYCADQAKDWQNMTGDYTEDDEVIEYEERNGIERIVIIEEV